MTAATQTIVFAGRTIRRFVAVPPAMVSTLVFPIIIMLLQLAAFGQLIGAETGMAYVDRITPLVALFTIVSGASITAQGVFADLHEGLYDRVATMPVWPQALLAGRVVGDLVRALAVAIVTVVVGCLLGFRLSMGFAAAVAFFGVVLLAALMWTSVGVLVGMLGRSEGAVQSALGPPGLLLFFLSSGFVPVNAFPDFLQPVVRVNPLSVNGNALVGLSSGGPLAEPVRYTLVWTLGVTALCWLVIVRRLRSR